jgi:hypothetical protein
LIRIPSHAHKPQPENGKATAGRFEILERKNGGRAAENFEILERKEVKLVAAERKILRFSNEKN